MNYDTGEVEWRDLGELNEEFAASIAANIDDDVARALSIIGRWLPEFSRPDVASRLPRMGGDLVDVRTFLHRAELALSRLREERDALTEISGVEYCTVHDGIQIEGNSDDCDQADTDPDAECHMVALFHKSGRAS